jgi:hypothetical protein
MLHSHSTARTPTHTCHCVTRALWRPTDRSETNDQNQIKVSHTLSHILSIHSALSHCDYVSNGHSNEATLTHLQRHPRQDVSHFLIDTQIEINHYVHITCAHRCLQVDANAAVDPRTRRLTRSRDTSPHCYHDTRTHRHVARCELRPGVRAAVTVDDARRLHAAQDRRHNQRARNTLDQHATETVCHSTARRGTPSRSARLPPWSRLLRSPARDNKAHQHMFAPTAAR